MKEHDDLRGAQDEAPSTPIDTAVLEEQLRARFDCIEAVHVVSLPGSSGAYLGVIRASSQNPDLGQQLVDFSAEHRVLLYPAISSPKEWAALERTALGADWHQLPTAEGALHHMDRLRTAGYPRSARRWLSRAIRRHRALLDHVQRSEQLPLHSSLLLCALAVEDALRLLFATMGEVYRIGPAAAAQFDELFVKPGHFSAADGRVSAELHGLAHQAAILGELCPDRSFDWLEAVKRAGAFFDRFERYIGRVFVSDAERRQRRLLALIGAGAGALVLIAALVWWFLSTRPVPPLPEHPRFAGAGGISATYFNGRLFETRVRSQTDTRILFSTMGAPVPGLTPDNFSIRWDGYLYFPEKATYVLCTEVDDGARLFFNGSLLVDDWKIHGLNRTCAPVRARKGWYPLRVEYFEVSKSATMRLLRGVDDEPPTIIPSKHLCCRQNKPARPPTKTAPVVPKTAPLPAKPTPPAPKPASPMRPKTPPKAP